MARTITTCNGVCGFARIDQLGRLCIPVEVRRAFGLTDQHEVRVCMHEKTLILRRADYEFCDDFSGHDLYVEAKIDKLGRLTVPIFYRRNLGLEDGMMLEIRGHTEDQQLQMRPYYTDDDIAGLISSALNINRIGYDCESTRQRSAEIERHLEYIQRLLETPATK